MLDAAADSAEGDQRSNGADRRSRDSDDRASRRRSRDTDATTSERSAGPTSGNADSGNDAPTVAATPRGRSSSAALGSTPIGPVQGDRSPVFFDESPTVTDVYNTSGRSFERSGVNDDVLGYVGLVSTGDSLFATVATSDSFDFVENVVVTAESEGVDLDDAETEIREGINTDVVDPAVAGGFDLAASEIGSGETIAEGRLQQISNNTTARIAEATGAASFVNNSVSPGTDGPIVLTFNQPNAEIDGGSDAAAGAVDREPRNFTLREVTSQLFSLSDFRAGDTLTVPANIGNEGFRAQEISAEENAETSLAFNRDGSTFNNPQLFDGLAEDFEDVDEATPTGDGSTIVGVFDGVVPIVELADFTGGTQNTVADLHTHPPRAAAFLPFADDVEQLTGERPDPNASLPNPNGFENVELFFNSAAFGETDPSSLELASIDALNETGEEGNELLDEQGNELLSDDDNEIGNSVEDELLNEGEDELINEEDGGIPDSPDVALEEDPTDETA